MVQNVNFVSLLTLLPVVDEYFSHQVNEFMQVDFIQVMELIVNLDHF